MLKGDCPLFSLMQEAQRKKLSKKETPQGDARQGLRAPTTPAPPFEKGGRKLF
ncbi:MAG: hypothetical protein ACI3X1_06655 [Eubacteriales bacterium]